MVRWGWLGCVGLVGACEPEPQGPEDVVMVIVAARDLFQGVTITEEDLYAVQIPPRYLPEGVFLSPEHVVGRIPSERVLANEFVRAGRLADPESGRASDRIPRGMRLVEVPLGDAAGLEPGRYVDAWYTPGARTCAVAQAAHVSSVETSSKGAVGYVELLVSAEHGLAMVAAARHPSFRLALRSDLDVTFDPEIACSH